MVVVGGVKSRGEWGVGHPTAWRIPSRLRLMVPVMSESGAAAPDDLDSVAGQIPGKGYIYIGNRN